MNRKNKLVFNTILMTTVSLIIRCIAMVWQVWLVGKIGSAGIGLFTLILTVGGLAATFAISGIRFTSTRLISEEMGLGRYASISKTVRNCCTYALFFGICGTVILYLTAERIGFLWIGDARTVLSLKILAFGLPFISIGAVLSGYFTSTGRVYKSSAVLLLEEILQVTLTIIGIGFVPDGDLELACACIVLANTISQGISLVLLYILYIVDRRRYSGGEISAKLGRRMFSIATPLALSAYARSSLTTAQQLLVPRGLRMSGMSAEHALSDYGIIQGMAFPVISFPACFLMALCELLVPELTEAQVSGRDAYISRITSRLLEQCIIFSFGVTAIMFTFSHELGILIFSSDEAGYYIRLLSLLVPIIYMDMITDACLKGLGDMLYSMSINVADSILSVALVIVLLPSYGIAGYIFMIFISELFNFVLSLIRLLSKVRLNISLTSCAMSAIFACGAAQGTQFFMRFNGLTYLNIWLTCCAIFAAGLCYIAMLFLCGFVRVK